MNKEGEEPKMATKPLLNDYYTIDQREAEEILFASDTYVHETGIFSDNSLNKKDRVKHAVNILDSRKKCK